MRHKSNQSQIIINLGTSDFPSDDPEWKIHKTLSVECPSNYDSPQVGSTLISTAMVLAIQDNISLFGFLNFIERQISKNWYIQKNHFEKTQMLAELEKEK